MTRRLLALCVGALVAAALVPAAAMADSSISVAVEGGGSVRVSAEGIGLACPPDCQLGFPDGTIVALEARPAGDSRFAGWGGLCAGEATTTCIREVPAGAAAQATARFESVAPAPGAANPEPAAPQCPSGVGVEIGSGTARLALSDAFRRYIRRRGLTLAPVRPATRDGSSLVFPITRGASGLTTSRIVWRERPGPAGTCRPVLDLNGSGTLVRLRGGLVVRGSQRVPPLRGRPGYTARVDERIRGLLFYGGGLEGIDAGGFDIDVGSVFPRSAGGSIELPSAGRVRVRGIGLRFATWPATGNGLWNRIANVNSRGRIRPPTFPLGRLTIDASAVRSPAALR